MGVYGRMAALLQPRDVFAELEYTPTPQQQAFHDAPEYDVLYGGAAGGGKTRALLMEGIRACVEHPGLRAAAVRRTMGEHEESLLAELSTLELHKIGARFTRAPSEVKFDNGSLLRFIYLEDMQSATRRQGGQYQLLLFDEVTLQSPNVVTYLRSRMRSGRPDLPAPRVRLTCNPGGVGHSYVKARYIDSTGRGQHVASDAQGRQVRFIQAKATDNPHLNPEYYAELDAIPDPQLRRSMRDGDWDQFAGQVFAEWTYDRHTVAPFPLDPLWRRFAGIDDGWTAPWAVAWFAVDPDGRMWVYRERTGTQVTSSVQARTILECEGSLDRDYPAEDVIHIADSAMWASNAAGADPAQIYAENGLSIRPATKGPGSRLARKRLLHQYLADGPACAQHRDLGWDTCPRLHVFQSCTDIIRTLPALLYDPHRPEDVDTTDDDHLYDALTYAMTAAVGGGQPLDVKAHQRGLDQLRGVGDGPGYLNSEAGLLSVSF